MATAKITPDRDAVVSEIEIAAPPERVFPALIEREQALQWGKSDQYEITEWEMDARLGGRWRFVSTERKAGGQIYRHHGEILEIDPPRVLAYTWITSWQPDPSKVTVVRWELTATKQGTHLKLTHSGLAPISGAAEGYSQGWPGLLQQIRDFVEKR
ncbi:MAG TPA: SRPBCC domain-containing protein [Candidatus Aquilonibacter sp.]|nr:SRPBCC domain-containing protein [Candidatus Aquilonibacter sp.]